MKTRKSRYQVSVCFVQTWWLCFALPHLQAISCMASMGRLPNELRLRGTSEHWRSLEGVFSCSVFPSFRCSMLILSLHVFHVQAATISSLAVSKAGQTSSRHLLTKASGGQKRRAATSSKEEQSCIGKKGSHHRAASEKVPLALPLTNALRMPSLDQVSLCQLWCTEQQARTPAG